MSKTDLHGNRDYFLKKFIIEYVCEYKDGSNILL